MKKIRNFMIIAFIVLLSSCVTTSKESSLVSIIGYVYKVEANEVKLIPISSYPYSMNSITIDNLESIFIEPLLFISFERCVEKSVALTFNPKYFTLVSKYNNHDTAQYCLENNITIDENSVTYVVPCSEKIELEPFENIIGNTEISYVLLDTDNNIISEEITISVDYKTPKTIKMDKKPVTRLYGLVPDEYFYNDNHVTLTAIPNDIPFVRYRGKLSVNCLTYSNHKYEISITPLNYNETVSISFSDKLKPNSNLIKETMDNLTENRKSIESKFNELDTFYYIIIKDSIEKYSEKYDNQDLLVKIEIQDFNDNVAYVETFSIPLISENASMSKFTEFKAATNGLIDAPAMIDTKVYLDAKFESFSKDDKFSELAITVYDPTGEICLNKYLGSIGGEDNDKLSGTLSSKSWSDYEIFKSIGASPYFVPKKEGMYKVELYGSDFYGTNFVFDTFEFKVIK